MLYVMCVIVCGSLVETVSACCLWSTAMLHGLRCVCVLCCVFVFVCVWCLMCLCVSCEAYRVMLYGVFGCGVFLLCVVHVGVFVCCVWFIA